MSPGPRIPEQLLDAIRDRVPLLEVVQTQVQMKRTGAWWVGLCPFHGERKASFSVHPQRRSFHCFGCGVHGDVIGFLVRLERRSFRDVVAQLAAQAGLATELESASQRPGWAVPPRPAPAPPKDGRGATEADRRRWALARWKGRRPIAEGSPVALYLAGRGLWPLPDCAHQVLGAGLLSHPETGTAQHPCMLAQIQAPDGSFTAVHTTYLAPNAAGGWGKLGGVQQAKRVLGPMAGGAIRLHPAAERLGLAEGIETALAASLLRGGVPVWACVSAGGLEAVELPFEVGAVMVFADRDKPSRQAPKGRGLQAGHALARRLLSLAVTCEVRLPLEPAGDFADVLAMRMGLNA